jgi:hypothetical protein
MTEVLFRRCQIFLTERRVDVGGGDRMDQKAAEVFKKRGLR